MDIQRFRYLLHRYYKSEIIHSEEQELAQWLGDADHNPELQTLIEEAWAQSQEKQAPVFSKESSDRMLHRFMQDIIAEIQPTQTPTVYSPFFLKKWIWAAAILLLIIGGGTLYYWFADIEKTVPTALHVSQPSPITPGNDGAILTLANGSRLILDSVSDGTIASQNGLDLILKEGILSYKNTKTPNSTLAFNTITTPKGKQFRLMLSDGTRVWLNAASSISYPVVFATSKRVVQITGEVYFEVMSNKARPFVVEKNKLSVVVTGTHFNINTYEDEASPQVTLLEGRLTVKNGSAEQPLMPGQQAAATGNNLLQLHTSVNTENIVDWKNGYFSFSGSDIQAVMRKLARWYNVEVVYQGSIPQMKFGGELSRKTELSQVLNILKESKVNFKIDHTHNPAIQAKIIVSQ